MLVDKLKSLAGDSAVLVDEPMSAHTTFRIGGPADVMVVPRSAEDAAKVISFVREQGIEPYVLGRGSNVLVSDAGIRGVVVQIAANLSALQLLPDGEVHAEAGLTNAKLAAEACRHGLAGYEFAAGIPGTVGGAAVMNAGAYGGEFKNVAIQLTCLDRDGATMALGPDEAGWGYRSSEVMRRGLVVLAARFRFSPDDPALIQQRMDDLAQRRTSKQPLDKPSAGSTFKRPPGNFAGKLIQDAGMQGYQVGAAQVSTKHAGFVVNLGGATSEDVLQVIWDVRASVFDQFGVMLEPEVRFWGFEAHELEP